MWCSETGEITTFCGFQYILKSSVLFRSCQLLEISSVGERGRYCLERIGVSRFETLMCASLIVLM